MDTTFYTILLIEDDELVRTVYSERLSEESLFRVETAVDGQDGWNKLQSNTYDLVFTGIQMPYKTGFEVYESMQEDTRLASIPTIIFSHLGRDLDKEKAHSLGIKHFIVRGQYTPNDVVNLIKSILVADNAEYHLRIAKDSVDYQQFVQAFWGMDCLECSEAEQLPVTIRLESSDERHLFSIKQDCEHCKK